MAKRSDWSRRSFLKTTAVGAGGLIILGGCANTRYLKGKQGPAASTFPLNADWLFGENTKGGQDAALDESLLQRITLPHTVTPLSWRNWNPGDWEKHWIYRKHFVWDKKADNQRVFVDFGAGMTAAAVWLNGKKIGEHTGGYLPFDFEITEVLQEGNNLLSVELDSRFDVNVPPNKSGRDSRSVDFWQPGGLYRAAYLHLVPQAFISDVFAKPVNVLTEDRQLALECTLDIKQAPDSPMKLVAALYDDKRKIKEVSRSVTASTGKKTVSLSIDNLKEIQLWDTENPRLYEVKAELLVEEKPVHDYVVRTGFREARFTEKGFFLNGKRVQLFGVNRHQFYPFAGGAMPDRVQRKDVRLLKEKLNCNMVRCSHYPQSEAFFDACDELGLMAWEEAAGWGSPLGDEVWKQRAVDAVAHMIRRDRNHPSVIVWGARLNETPDDVALYSKTKKIAYELDGSRQTTGAMVGGKHDTKNFVQDVFSYNDYKKSKTAYGKWQPELLPPRTDFPYLVSEAVGTLSGPARYYRRIDPPAVLQGQAEAHARAHDLAGSNERYCGLLAWSGFDYPSGNGNQYDGVKYTGVVDLFRELKPGAAVYQAQINPRIRPVIAPAFYWHLADDTLSFLQAEEAMICSNCERLELFIGQDHFATVTPDKERFPHLPYPPSFVHFGQINSDEKPELRIDGYAGNKRIISQSFSADTARDRLLVQADDRKLYADGADTTRVVFRMVDKFGMPRPYAKGDVKFSLNGPGILIGDNPFAFEDTGGVGAVWIRTRPAAKGKITLQVQHASGRHTVAIEAI